MRRSTMFTGIAVVCVLASSVFLLLASLRHAEELDQAGADMRAFCRATKSSVRADLSALRSDSPGARAAALRRITDDRIYFGDSSARICLKDKMPSSDEWSACLFTSDVTCVLERTERIYRLLDKDMTNGE